MENNFLHFFVHYTFIECFFSYDKISNLTELDCNVCVFNVPCRYKCFLSIKNDIQKHEGGLEAFSRGYERFGLNRTPEGIVYRDWAPGAEGVFLIGDFSKFFF